MVINSALNKVSQRQHVDANIQYTFCDHLNISVCPATEVTKSFTITVYNPIARNIDTNIRIPVSSLSVRVFGPNGTQVSYTVLPVTNVTKYVRGKRGNAPYELVFPANDLPPLGLAMYEVNFGPNFPKMSGYKTPVLKQRKRDDVDVFGHNVHKRPGFNKLELSPNNNYSIENQYLRLTFSTDTGRLVKVENLKSKVTLPIDQQFYWYESDGSGAYIFDPKLNKPSDVSPGNKAKISIFQSKDLQEVHQVFTRWVSQTVRLYSNKPYAEFEYTVGPIKKAPSPRVGKEVISRFDTSLKTNGVFYTDANGREMQLRKRNYRPTWTYQSE
jgi:lysosomal alpha-mannosidase